MGHSGAGPVYDARIMNIRADNDGRFKGEADDQRRVLTEFWLSDIPILMIEGTRINTPLMDVAKKYKSHTTIISAAEMNVGEISVPPAGQLAQPRELVVLMALQTPEVMRAHLEARCAKKNKTFRKEYWITDKLNYEGMKRYPNSFAKNNIKAERFIVDVEYQVQEKIISRIRELITEVLHE